MMNKINNLVWETGGLLFSEYNLSWIDEIWIYSIFINSFKDWEICLISLVYVIANLIHKSLVF